LQQTLEGIFKFIIPKFGPFWRITQISAYSNSPYEDSYMNYKLS